MKNSIKTRLLVSNTKSSVWGNELSLEWHNYFSLRILSFSKGHSTILNPEYCNAFKYLKSRVNKIY